MSLSRNVRGREFQRHRPATEKLLSPNWRIDYFPVKFTDDSAEGGGRQLRPFLNPPLAC